MLDLFSISAYYRYEIFMRIIATRRTSTIMRRSNVVVYYRASRRVPVARFRRKKTVSDTLGSLSRVNSIVLCVAARVAGRLLVPLIFAFFLYNGFFIGSRPGPRVRHRRDKTAYIIIFRERNKTSGPRPTIRTAYKNETIRMK